MKILRMLLWVAVLSILSTAEQGGSLQSSEPVTAREIVARMAEKNRKRQEELQSYTGQRRYHLSYTGFPGKREADLVVQVKYEAPDNKDFTVISESGSHWMVNRVLKRLLETEKEAANEKSQAKTALTDENYRFTLLGQQELRGRASYVLEVEPKTDNKLLYRGKIWVDAADFALSKIEGEPAKRPSIWISKIVVQHTYQKIGEFWLPAENESNTDVRLGGHATLKISYGDYRVVSEANSPQSRAPPQQSE